MVDIISTLNYMENQFGLSDIIIPFVIIFTICFALIDRTRIFAIMKTEGTGKDAKTTVDNRNTPINITVSLAIALTVVMLHVTGVYTKPINALNQSLASVSLILVASLCLLIMIGFFGKLESTSLKTIIGIISLIGVIYIFLLSMGMEGIPNYIRDLSDETVGTILVILTFGIIISFITSSEKKDSKGNKLTFLNDIDKAARLLRIGGHK